MPATPNKIKFGLSKCSYAIATLTPNASTGVTTVSYGTPVALPGAVSLSLSAEGEQENFYADDSIYYILNSNSGYTGSLELALIPESFLTDVLQETADNNGVMVENRDVESKYFALLFQFDGDQRKTRHVMYYCSASRPGLDGKTLEGSKEVQTETLNITAAPLPECVIDGTTFEGGLVKAKTGAATTTSVYDGWYSEVYVPDTSSATTTS